MPEFANVRVGDVVTVMRQNVPIEILTVDRLSITQIFLRGSDVAFLRYDGIASGWYLGARPYLERTTDAHRQALGVERV